MYWSRRVELERAHGSRGERVTNDGGWRAAACTTGDRAADSGQLGFRGTLPNHGELEGRQAHWQAGRWLVLDW
jgi:hypothetical protein